MVDTAQAPSSPTSKPRKILAALNKWLVWRLAALCFWYWYLALRGHELGQPALQYIGLFSLAPVLRHLMRRKWWLGLLAIPAAGFYYFAVFPFVGIYLGARLIGKFSALPHRVLQLAASAGGFLLGLVSFLVLLGVIPSLKNPAVLAVLGYVNLGVINLLFLCALAWSSNPLAPVLRFSGGVWRVVDWFVESWTKEKPTTETAGPASVPLVKSLSSFLHEHIVDEEGQLRNVEALRRSIGPAFAAAILAVFLILVSGYALTYYALQRAGINVLSGLGSAPTLGTSWYYSLTISAAGLHEGVIAVSSVGRVIQSLHLVNAAMFLASALFLFSCAIGDRGRDEFQKLQAYPMHVVQKVDSYLIQLQGKRALKSVELPPVEIEGEVDSDTGEHRENQL